MSVAYHLGIEDAETPMMREAHASWRAWCEAEPDLAVVNELFDLRDWGKTADFDLRDQAYGSLAKTGAIDGHNVPAATTALTWLLLPGADRLTRSLAERADDADMLVASNIWIAAKTANWARPRSIAAVILRETRRNVLAELGLGQRARRSDYAWANSTPRSDIDQLSIDDDAREFELSAAETLRRLLLIADAEHVIRRDEADLLLELATTAHRLGKAMHRGRGGICTSEISEVLAINRGVTGRQIRRQVKRIVERLRTLAATETVRDALSTEPVIGSRSSERHEQYGLDVIASLWSAA